MSIVAGAAVSYSPLLYRGRDRWGAVSEVLRQGVIQPTAATQEDDTVLTDFEHRIEAGFSAVKEALGRHDLDALVLLTADRGSQFDSSHVPQFHIQSGGEVWGNPAIPELDESPRQLGFACEDPVSKLLLEELVRDGFDISEAKGEFRPVGNPAQGATPAAVEAVSRLAGGLPIIPISVNCHVAPMVSGRRMHRFGLALSRAAALTKRRLGILVSGGLSGDPAGSRSGWIDDVFDNWMLARLERGRSVDLASVWDVPSHNRLSGTTEARLWMTAAAALEASGCHARVLDYLPIYHAATGVAFATWEN